LEENKMKNKKRGIKKEIKQDERNLKVANLKIIGAEWNGEALESVKIVAESLKNLTELFKVQNIVINLGVSTEIEGSLDINNTAKMEEDL
jgi:hypothetical protein